MTVQSALPVVVAIELTPQAAEHVVVHGAAAQPAVASRLTISGDALRTAPARLSSRSLQQMLATLPGWASEDNGLVHVRGVDDGFLYVEDGVPVYDRVDQLFGVAPDPAGIGSLHVMTGYVPAEYGLKSGAVIEIRSTAVPRQRWTGELDAGTGSDALAAGRVFASGPLGRADLALNAAGERSDRFLDPVHPDNFHNQGGSASGGARAAIALGPQDRLNLTGSYGGASFDVPHGDEQEAAGQDQRESLRQGAAAGVVAAVVVPGPGLPGGGLLPPHRLRPARHAGRGAALRRVESPPRARRRAGQPRLAARSPHREGGPRGGAAAPARGLHLRRHRRGRGRGGRDQRRRRSPSRSTTRSRSATACRAPSGRRTCRTASG